MFNSLASKVTRLVVGLLLALGIASITAFAVLSSRQVDATIRADARSTATQLRRLLNDEVARVNQTAHYAARSPRIRGLVLSADPATVQDQCPSLLTEFGQDAVVVLGPGGAVLGSAGVSNSFGQGERRLFQSALGTAIPVSGLVVHGENLYVLSCWPVADNELVKGALIFYQSVGKEAVKLSNAGGMHVAFRVGAHVAGSSLPGLELPAKPVIGPREIRVSGKTYIALFQPLRVEGGEEEVGFVTLQDLDTITAPYRQTEVTFASLLGIIVASGLVCGAVFGRNIVRPLDGVVHAARQLRAGTWPERLDVTRQDEIGLLQGAFNDMTVAVRAAQDRLRTMLDVDPLTGLDNHRRFQERLSETMRFASASSAAVGLMLLDIDEFAALNERDGHQAGDEVLVVVATTIRRCVAGDADVARYGGGQFAVLSGGLHAREMAAIAGEIRSELEHGGSPVQVSGGCADSSQVGYDPEAILLAVELALERAKQLGRDQVCAFDTVPGVEEGGDPHQLLAYLRDQSFATIQALAAAVDAKDSYTNGHSERVAFYARELARQCGATAEFAELVFQMGTLHDVGKIGVPDSILQKPGKLDPEELRIMETHPVLGEMILRKAQRLEKLLPGVRNHHERWDGKGYPDGLAGEEIPYAARILALADTYDAMTSDRPYRKGLSVEFACGEIAKMAGIQFDPELARAFLEIVTPQRAAA